MAILEQVASPADIRRRSIAELETLASEIRQLIIATTARTGGHTAPSLGVVELTIALHYVFDTPADRLVWDVGHQCYAHKIITGRRDRFPTLRQLGGIAGFPKRAESEYDVFDTGHSGDSISAVLGMAVGDRLRGVRRRSIAVIGDGSIVSGIAFEALNNAGAMKPDLVVVLNDNEMSIARSTGAMANYLNRVITGRMYNRLREDAWNLLGHLPKDLGERTRTAARKLEEGLKNLVVPSLLFEELGFRYLGPVNGHNLRELIETFQRVKQLRGPVLIHVVTRKGKGYQPAEKHPERFHGTGPFEPATGTPVPAGGTTFTAAFGEKLVELAATDDRIVAITAGMCLGTGLAQFRDRFPDRFFDVGICEQHAVAFGAGLAQAGLKPVVAIYSTFLTRALDQIIQDVTLQQLPVVLAVDRAGLVGEDGPTHHGTFDLSYLTMLPGMVVLAPSDEAELKLMLEFAVNYHSGPVAIRYPRGGCKGGPTRSEPVKLGKARLLCEGADGCVLAIGSGTLPSSAAAELLAGQNLKLTVVDARFAKPLDEPFYLELAERHDRIVTVEENTLLGGFGAAVSLLLNRGGKQPRLLHLGLPDRFIEHGGREQLLENIGFSASKLAKEFLTFFSRERPR